MTIYLPDGLAEEVRDKLGDQNISAICQAALRAELSRAEACAKLDEDGYERAEVYDSKKDRDVAFRGRTLGETDSGMQVWITPKHAIAVYDTNREELYVYDDFAELEENEHVGMEPPDNELLSLAAGALGESYVEELDI